MQTGSCRLRLVASVPFGALAPDVRQNLGSMPIDIPSHGPGSFSVGLSYSTERTNMNASARARPTEAPRHVAHASMAGMDRL